MLKALRSSRFAAAYAQMAPAIANSPARFNSQKSTTYSTTALKRWSCLNEGVLPSIPDIKTIHVYDFDNTLFLSPLPNPQLWNGPTIGFLQSYECFSKGGWWHDVNILGSTGEGVEIEEARAWAGWWNEQIAQLVQLSMKQKDALTVLLTGRSEAGFAELIGRMIKSKQLAFDLVCLKPEVGPNNQRFATTMKFKQNFLDDLMRTYREADEIRVYEDRVKHVKGFREFFEQFNRDAATGGPSATRKPIAAEVIQVMEMAKYLSPVTEAAEIQRMINAHNGSLGNPGANITKSPYGRLELSKTTFYTGYLLSNADAVRIIDNIFLPLISSSVADTSEIKFMSNNILITPRSAPKPIRDKVGGLGKVVRWRLTDTGHFEHKLWAAKVSPLDSSVVIHTDNPEPIIVLGMRKGVRPADANKIRNWTPVTKDDSLVFDTVVGEKTILRVQEEDVARNGAASRGGKRRFQSDTRDEADTSTRDYRDMQQHRPPAPEYSGGRPPQNHNNRHYNGPPPPFRGNRGRGGRGGRGGHGRGRGRGPGGRDNYGSRYRSLDDHAVAAGSHDNMMDGRGSGRGPGGGPVMNY
ncbi:hypothetical protein H109_05148 [Trichophyton interdigitale MR816]|uniref:Swiss Army Knife RNA repair protein HAD domain-containing protein n=1 Tax=Trichophyton interdigitale (strain MR816) TaxID=1215338 RepID=A0A059J5I8_TRIIM|nr:hypothetical protein H109_05148 [Trichophyton interdigitale MR816]